MCLCYLGGRRTDINTPCTIEHRLFFPRVKHPGRDAEYPPTPFLGMRTIEGRALSLPPACVYFVSNETDFPVLIK
jgi:hypothetical protein